MTWGANPGSAQTVCASSPQNWKLAANKQPADHTGVQTYPNIKQHTHESSSSEPDNNSDVTIGQS